MFELLCTAPATPFNDQRILPYMRKNTYGLDSSSRKTLFQNKESKLQWRNKRWMSSELSSCKFQRKTIQRNSILFHINQTNAPPEMTTRSS